MSPLRIVRYARTASTPWKNGLGVTRQLAVHPARATAEDFEWRVSIARLDESADFSLFPGVDRCLAVLEGEMTLQRAGAVSAMLTSSSPPVRFGGEVASRGTVVRGPVLDLNVMCRASAWHASLVRLKPAMGESHLLPAGAETVMLCSLSSELQLTLGGERLTLGRYDLLIIDGDAVAESESLSASELHAYRIGLQRRSHDG